MAVRGKASLNMMTYPKRLSYRIKREGVPAQIFTGNCYYDAGVKVPWMLMIYSRMIMTDSQ